MTAWVNGAAADRLLDERHAGLLELGRRTVVPAPGWQALSEVTFNVYGDRGSIDLLGGHVETRSALVGAVKSEIGSLEETNRVLDTKVRVAPQIVRDRLDGGQRRSRVS